MWQGAMAYGDLRSKIEALNKALAQVDHRLGYTEVKDRGRISEYRIHTLVGPDIVIRVGEDVAAAEAAVLKELAKMALYYKPALLLPDYPKWLVPEALAFCENFWTKPAPADIYLFGELIDLSKDIDMPCITREQLVYVGPDYLEPFRYWPTKKSAYTKDVYYNTCMDWNRAMYGLIERKRLPPSQAIDGLTRTLFEDVERIVGSLSGLPLVPPVDEEKVKGTVLRRTGKSVVLCFKALPRPIVLPAVIMTAVTGVVSANRGSQTSR